MLYEAMLPKFRSSVFSFFLLIPGGQRGEHTTLFVTEVTAWGFQRRLEEYLTQNRGRRAASKPRARPPPRQHQHLK